MRKIGILTGGGDCPGLNAVIRGVVEKCAEAGMEVFGFRDGWRGALNAKGHWLTLSEVEGIQTLGGTIIGSSRTNVLAQPDGTSTIINVLDALGLEGLGRHRRGRHSRRCECAAQTRRERYRRSENHRQ